MCAPISSFSPFGMPDHLHERPHTAFALLPLRSSDLRRARCLRFESDRPEITGNQDRNEPEPPGTSFFGSVPARIIMCIQVAECRDVTDVTSTCGL